MRLILYNDDLGVTHGLNEAVDRLHTAGLTTAAALRTNGPAFDDAAARLSRLPGLEVGLHLNLTEGPPTAPPEAVPDLLGSEGCFRRRFAGYLSALRRSPALAPQIEIELAAQLDRAAAAGVEVNHVNGHQHVHMVPAVFEIACRLAAERGIRWVRIPREPFYPPPSLADGLYGIPRLNPVKHVLLNVLARQAFPVAAQHGLGAVGWFVGVLFTGRMSAEILERALHRLGELGAEAAEVLFHPALIDHPADDALRATLPAYYFAGERRLELDALESAQMRDYLAGHRLIAHRDLGG
jgi:predicted glycoside hydrolase/deacetylase ChbG (UPF0249 family)